MALLGVKIEKLMKIKNKKDRRVWNVEVQYSLPPQTLSINECVLCSKLGGVA